MASSKSERHISVRTITNSVIPCDTAAKPKVDLGIRAINSSHLELLPRKQVMVHCTNSYLVRIQGHENERTFSALYKLVPHNSKTVKRAHDVKVDPH